jgi:arylsulfatase A-like enzyme
VPEDANPSEKLARELIHGYFACVSFIDAQVGLLLDELDRLQLRDDTVIVLWGDHGFHLGDQAIWGKHTNFEYAVHSPLIVSAPGQKNPGRKTDALVEFVDVYPSLCELCQLSLPAHLEGISFVPLLNDSKKPWKKAAISQYQHWKEPYNRIMGYSLRTDRYRYIEWQDRENNNKVVARELYDHSRDPEESLNIADQPEYVQTVSRLSEMVRAGWRALVPK